MPHPSARPRDGHPIQVAARRTGLTPEVLRIWEKRYGVVKPSRLANGRRVYSDEDIEKLRLIRKALTGGRRIGDVADLTTPELETLIQEEIREDFPGPRSEEPSPTNPDARATEIQKACLEAILNLDGQALESRLQGAMISLPGHQFVDQVVSPLLQKVGEKWREESLAPYQEHMASSILRTVLTQAIPSAPDGAPTVVVTTPAGQRHEFGALLAAFTAALVGWNVVFLGADLPAADISRAIAQTKAKALALSIVYPHDDPALPSQLEALAKGLPRDTAILVGGRAASGYAEILSRVGAFLLPDTRSLRAALQGMHPVRS